MALLSVFFLSLLDDETAWGSAMPTRWMFRNGLWNAKVAGQNKPNAIITLIIIILVMVVILYLQIQGHRWPSGEILADGMNSSGHAWNKRKMMLEAKRILGDKARSVLGKVSF